MILVEVTRTNDIVELHAGESQKLKATIHSEGTVCENIVISAVMW